MTSKQKRQLRRKEFESAAKEAPAQNHSAGTPGTGAASAKVTSTPQIKANQANAQKSTGPVTAEGKETASRNSQTHNLCSTRVMPNELVSFDQLLQGFTKLYNPQTDIERSLVRRCADYQIRIDRALSAESAFVNECVNRLIEETEGITWEEGLGLLFLDKRYAPKMSLVLRYQSQATRGYNQTRKELQQLIGERLRAEAAAAAEQAETKRVMQNGFVSQNASKPQAGTVAAVVNVPQRS